MVKFISVVIVGGLIAFATYQIIQLVRIVKERKKAKSRNKEKNENGRDCDS